jgi:hypothetical protein
MTGAEALALWRSIRALYQSQREHIASHQPDVEGALLIGVQIDELIAELPEPASLTALDEITLDELRSETAVVDDLRKATMTTLQILRAQFISDNVTANKGTEAVRAYQQPGAPGANFLDQHR